MIFNNFKKFFLIGKIPKKFFLILNTLCILFFSSQVLAANVGDSLNFNVEDDFDISQRSQVAGELVKISPNIYFYVEKNWWDSQFDSKKSQILYQLDGLSSEFNNRIYPVLTSVYGSEWNPGVDNDPRVTIFFHSIKDNAGGYFRSNDEYLKLQIPDSNEKEMIYINLSYVDDPKLKVFVAHEFTHLIEFNQKERLNKIQEEVWLNEGRADYSSTILGYDDNYDGSNLQARVKDFLQNPTDSIAEWQENKYDYASVSLFLHYLTDHYSLDVLSNSLKSKLVGIESINYALSKQGSPEDFSQIFTNWEIATIINDCSLDIKYCYLNQNLKKLKINPTLNFLPLSGNSSLSVSDSIKNWSGNWQKVIGGNGGNLKLNFSGLSILNFKVSYVVFDKDGNYTVNSMKLDQNEKGSLEIDNFGTQYLSLFVVPSLQSKTLGFNGGELSYPYSFTVSIAGSNDQSDQDIVQKLLDQIASLKKQIADLQKALGQNGSNSSCVVLNSNLHLGLKNDEVACLQQALKDQGEGIYPEGLVTGYFGSLTKSAVIRFQEKYNIPNTGFVGPLTRQKINQLL